MVQQYSAIFSQFLYLTSTEIKSPFKDTCNKNNPIITQNPGM